MEHQPEVFIELGTLWGGVPLALNERFPDLEIYSFDKSQKRSKRQPKRHGRTLCSKKVRFIASDLLNGDCQELIKLLGGNKKKILYCDNGNKLRELHKFAGYLKPGDLIGVHDWLTRPHVSQRCEEYQIKRLEKDGVLENTAIVDEHGIQNFLEKRKFKKYMWELFEKYPLSPWINEKGESTSILLTDTKASSRFWIRE